MEQRHLHHPRPALPHCLSSPHWHYPTAFPPSLSTALPFHPLPLRKQHVKGTQPSYQGRTRGVPLDRGPYGIWAAFCTPPLPTIEDEDVRLGEFWATQDRIVSGVLVQWHATSIVISSSSVREHMHAINNLLSVAWYWWFANHTQLITKMASHK